MRPMRFGAIEVGHDWAVEVPRVHSLLANSSDHGVQSLFELGRRSVNKFPFLMMTLRLSVDVRRSTCCNDRCGRGLGH